MLADDNILASYDTKEDIILATDAFQVRVAAVLLHRYKVVLKGQ